MIIFLFFNLAITSPVLTLVLNLIGSKISYFSILYDLICEGTAVPNGLDHHHPSQRSPTDIAYRDHSPAETLGWGHAPARMLLKYGQASAWRGHKPPAQPQYDRSVRCKFPRK